MAFNPNGPHDYQAIAVSQTDLLVQGNSSTASATKTGGWIKRIIITVVTAGATGICSIKDGTTGSAIPLAVSGTPAGIYEIDLDIITKNVAATPGWYITTGAAATAVVVGNFLGTN